jgi:hypothetical protein
MSGILITTVEGDIGNSFGLVREDGTAEPVTVADPAAFSLAPGDRNNAPLAWNAGLAQWMQLGAETPISANGMIGSGATTMVVGTDTADLTLISGVGHEMILSSDEGSLSGLSGQVAFRWTVSGPNPLLGFYGGGAVAKPDVTTGDLASLQTALVNLGLINLV